MTRGSEARRSVALGIDVGGTKVALGLVDADGAVRARRLLLNEEAPNLRALLQRVVEVAGELAASAAGALVGVGVGMCELVDRDGQVRSAAAVDWTTPDLVGALGHLGQVTVDADVRAAARAEAVAGAGAPFSSFAYVTVGTGISHCLVLDGEPYEGARGFAQLVGSTRLLSEGPLEQIAAGPALAARYDRAAGAGLTRGEDVLARAVAGDEAAARAVSETGSVLGAFVALLVDLLDPDAVVIGGGLGSAPGPYWGAMVASARERAWSPAAPSVPILPAALGPDSGVVGAGLIALNEAATSKGAR
jgi:glucokinase